MDTFEFLEWVEHALLGVLYGSNNDMEAMEVEIRQAGEVRQRAADRATAHRVTGEAMPTFLPQNPRTVDPALVICQHRLPKGHAYESKCTGCIHRVPHELTDTCNDGMAICGKCVCVDEDKGPFGSRPGGDNDQK